ncbi:MAG: bifunctional demethylmenaquinone methyltransferase/2-methoxy-6-polyprenyl-1,4-benzoquinol methylase [Gammaproteobacteria bacterium RIFCSPHIGHO2_12_FULL_41_20]|nr:MAG: bifunctional demethylmenaquinone methyltransferase/2-methoxy-6-polyprenyl-1,4-benzoquinol methylase [Gammaproteobacteria bacterium RIFCSPHIGHO2_12_FULL_41_20]
MPKHVEKNTTHFGYQQVPVTEKEQKVADVFRSVADKYDIMNDCMSLGLHRLWKRFTIAKSGVRQGQRILDVASGSGDLAQLFAKCVGPQGRVVATDINEKMLSRGRDRLIDHGIVGNTVYVQADAERLPFQGNYFDCITIAFGLRNVTDQAAALRSMYRVLKPGGKLLVLEFSHPDFPALRTIYDFYSFNVIPKLGELICQDRDSYQYLVESIRMHPDQKTLQTNMCECGFDEVTYFNLAGGIVALHQGYKY